MTEGPARDSAPPTGHGRRRVGGRRRAKAEGRTHEIKTRFTAEELAQVQANAEAAGWSVKAWVAMAALTPPVGPVEEGSLGEREQLMVEFIRAQRQLRGIATNVNQLAAGLNRLLASPGSGGLGRPDEVAAAVENVPQALRAVAVVGARVRDAVIALERSRR